MITQAEPIDADALRIRHEFLTVPHLRVTVAQASFLMAVPPRHARTILEGLVADGFLCRAGDDAYIKTPPAA